jgi:hypothetical protein
MLCSAKATASHQSRQYNCALYFPLRLGNSLRQVSGKKMHTSLIRRMHIHVYMYMDIAGLLSLTQRPKQVEDHLRGLSQVGDLRVAQ